MIGLLDTALAGLVLAVSLLRLAPRRLRPRRLRGRRLLVLDGSYDLATMRARDLLPVITTRDLGGWFERVWTVHPLIGASPEHDPSVAGAPVVVELDEHHVVIEGHVRDRRVPVRLPRLGFAVAQGRLLASLDRLLTDEGIGIVQVGDPFYQGLLGWALARAHRLPLAIRIGGNYDMAYEVTGRLAYPQLLPSRRAEVALSHFVLARTDLVLAVNQDNLEYSVANRARRERCVVVPAYGNVLHPVHLSEPADRAPADLPAGLAAPYVVSVSRLEPVKHPADVLEAVAVARRRVPDLALVLVGDGSMRAELEALARRLGIEGATFFVGNQPQTWIASALAGAAAVLSPLTGRALVEAALSGAPLVAYDVEWQSEVVEDGTTGRLAPFGDVVALGEATADVVLDPGSRGHLGANARRAVLELVAPEAVAARLRAAYEEILPERGGPVA